MYKLLKSFLRLFAPYRAMEEQVHDLTVALTDAVDSRNRADASADFWQAKALDLEKRLEEAHRSEVESRELVADFLAQQRYGFGVYHRAPQIPAESSDAAVVPPMRVQARRIVREHNRHFLRQMAGLEPTE